jgi:hypothetical protein
VRQEKTGEKATARSEKPSATNRHKRAQRRWSGCTKTTKRHLLQAVPTRVFGRGGTLSVNGVKIHEAQFFSANNISWGGQVSLSRSETLYSSFLRHRKAAHAVFQRFPRDTFREKRTRAFCMYDNL